MLVSFCFFDFSVCECLSCSLIIVNHGELQVIAATNRADILDPALMRSGRLDRKIEFPHPTEEARARILQVCLLNSDKIFGIRFYFSIVSASLVHIV